MDHVRYDTISHNGITNANLKELRQARVPQLRPDQGRCAGERGRGLPQQLGQHHREQLAVRARRRPEDATAESR